MKKLEVISARELLEKSFPKPYFAVEELFSEGGNIVAAPPKTGKSWMMLQMCLAVARGEDFLGFKTNRSSTLYFDLEEGPMFGQERLIKILDGREVPDNFELVFSGVETMQSGFIDQLQEKIKSDPEIKLVVIDTGARIIGRQKKNSMTAYADDYEIYGRLKKFGSENRIAVVIVTHTTKSGHPEDPILDVIGTNGVVGSVDNILVLKKEQRQSKEAVLYKEGKNIRQGEYDVVFDEAVCSWKMLGVHDADGNSGSDKAGYLTSPVRRAVIRVLKDRLFYEGRATDILEDSEDLDLKVTSSAKEIGGFLHRNQQLFLSEDHICVEIIKNGTGSSRYRISKADDEWQDVGNDNVPF